MCKVTYDYISKASPVLMRERVNGWCVAEYIAYIDRGGYSWTLYPYRRHAHLKDVAFTKKKVMARDVRVISPPQKEIKKTNDAPKPQERVLGMPEQIKLI